MKGFVGQVVALISLIALPAATAQAQNRGVSPMHYNNPFNQFNMYNNGPGMYYNNPFNQSGMYNKSASMKYNNPYNQSGMYNKTPTMKYNSGYDQTGMYNNAAGTSSSISAGPTGLTGGAGSSYGNNNTSAGQSLLSGSVGAASSNNIGSSVVGVGNVGSSQAPTVSHSTGALGVGSSVGSITGESLPAGQKLSPNLNQSRGLRSSKAARSAEDALAGLSGGGPAHRLKAAPQTRVAKPRPQHRRSSTNRSGRAG
ncbi:MAG: hypothetical protein ACLP7Q_01365 [Isosphaeraceae bacterium]